MWFKEIRSLALFFLLCIVSLSDEKSIAPDVDKISHDIAAGRGLYYNFKQVFELTTSNFKSVVFNEEFPKTWVVEFYNSWCGHCHRFAPIFKSLAVDIYDWRDVVAIGAVDCSNDLNNQLCRDYEIMAYPYMKIFPIGNPNTSLGSTFTKGNAQNMKLDIIKEIIDEDSNGKKRPNLNLQPFNHSDLNILWFGVPLNVHYIFLVIVDQSETPYLGAELALDLYSVKSIQVRTVYSDNKGLLLQLPTVNYPTLYVVERNNRYQLLPLGNSGNFKDDIYYEIKGFLTPKGVSVPKKVNVTVENLDIDVSKIMERIQMKEDIKKKLQSKELSDVVFQADLEGALRYSLYHEIGVHKIIEGEKLNALKKYITVLYQYFPIAIEGRRFLRAIRDDTLHTSIVHGKNFSDFAKIRETSLNDNVFLTQQKWIGCQGSEPRFRGYPCSLWTLFHTLTVQAENKKEVYPNSEPQEVLQAMTGYITHFFGCTDCSQHFQQMAVTISGNVSSLDDSILWLWRAHNAVNLRLAGDVTEDPEHKKIQFPSTQSCPECRNEHNEWISANVLKFLKGMYTSISYFQWDDLFSLESTSTVKPPVEISYSKRLRHEIGGNENDFETLDSGSKSSWDFNVFDISLCVVLYVSSVVILLLVCIKFVMRKNHKKKNSFDVYHSKV